jgi:oligopeptide/dipeptide ABC transporter ATP-binding protein
LSATPTVDVASRRERIVLSGELPSPLNPPAGCAFHTRCPIAMPMCSQQVPELAPHAGRQAACHALSVTKGTASLV